MSAWTCRQSYGKAAPKIVPPRSRIPSWKGLGADSEEKREPVSDIDLSRLYVNSTGIYGFLYSGGTYTTLSGPNYPEAFGINSAGQIVGYYFPAGVRSGFLYSGGTYTTLSYPLAANYTSNYTSAWGINDEGQIVGIYQEEYHPPASPKPPLGP